MLFRGCQVARGCESQVKFSVRVTCEVSRISLTKHLLSNVRHRPCLWIPPPDSSMAPRTCALCQDARAIIKRPKTGQQICKECFFYVFETEVHNTIIDSQLFKPGDRVAIGASGGKGYFFLHKYMFRCLMRCHRFNCVGTCHEDAE